MRRAVLMTRQAISPRLAIRMRLNMLFLSLDLGRDPSLAVGAYGRAVWLPWYIKIGRRQRSKSGPSGVPAQDRSKTETGLAGPRTAYGFPALPTFRTRP